jgi:hypothetical protein
MNMEASFESLCIKLKWGGGGGEDSVRLRPGDRRSRGPYGHSGRCVLKEDFQSCYRNAKPGLPSHILPVY